MTAFKEEHVPLASRIWISVADSSVAILQSLVATSALTYYFVKLRGLDTGLAGIVWLLFGLWNAVNDPLFGYLSDRTKSALGRRLPYIRYGAPIFALGFGLFWVDIPGTSGNQMLMFWQMLVALFIYDSLYTAIATSIYIMPYEMAVSNKARSTIYVWKIIFMVFAIVVPLVLERFKPDVGDLAGISSFRWLMIGFGVTMAILVFVSTYFYRENHFTQAEEQPGFVEAFKNCFKNRSFVVFETISFTIMFAQTCIMLYFTGSRDYRWGGFVDQAARSLGDQDQHPADGLGLCPGLRRVAFRRALSHSGSFWLPDVWLWLCGWDVPDSPDERRRGRFR
jgi:GPH family glycoside/pentoside/hexuronide:cation symporter